MEYKVNWKEKFESKGKLGKKMLYEYSVKYCYGIYATFEFWIEYGINHTKFLM